MPHKENNISSTNAQDAGVVITFSAAATTDNLGRDRLSKIKIGFAFDCF
jgi:hypothetical protein